jgi:hypothetical protein
VIRAALTEIANVLREEGAIDESECCIDATFPPRRAVAMRLGPRDAEKA